MKQQLRPVNLKVDLAETREFELKNVLQLKQLVHQDTRLARAALMKQIGQLTLTPPRDTRKGPVSELSCGVDLLSSRNDVMPVVARDGIEQHYTALTIPLIGVYLNPALELR